MRAAINTVVSPVDAIDSLRSKAIAFAAQAGSARAAAKALGIRENTFRDFLAGKNVREGTRALISHRLATVTR